MLIGAIAALWAATGGTNALTKGIHRAYEVEEQRPFVLRYAIAVGLTILGAIGTDRRVRHHHRGAMVTEELAVDLRTRAAGLGRSSNGSVCRPC